MATTLPQGTKEYLILDVSDALNQLQTLDGASVKYDVKDKDGNMKYTQQAATNVAMKVYCLIDTLQGGAWTAGEYRLYLNFTTAPELPRLGPFSFTVDAS